MFVQAFLKMFLLYFQVFVERTLRYDRRQRAEALWA